MLFASALPWIVAACIIMLAVRKAFFPWLRNSRLFQHLFFGTTAVTAFIWSFHASIANGLAFHFLLLTSITLMLGFRAALLVGALVVTLYALFIGFEHGDWAQHFLALAVIPAAVTYVAYAWIYHHLPRHPFVYIFLNAFIAAAISLLMAQVALALLIFWQGALNWEQLWQNYLSITPLLMFPEALLNGMAVTLMVVYRPNWLATFSDNTYLND
ncbi:hypothetical protein CWI84_01470 [Idiomarina tyrosinivorans]|uniref:Uncharacterized protein n=1 Tax=Idiomarina tyrosinivorans TaxID=1445662 RepID=A0A432ZU35_9GAMM|nr:energy-coupling factor ABC transporter permease [Idiomarina tyrosinivorans]RUO81455.1 hypothetical protein CWI84_01470 [Idiomarina tyrosinivorans]